MVVDYRRLNKRVEADSYPLTHIEDLLNKTAKAKIFSKVDLVSGFHQIPVSPASQKFLAFTAVDDSYTYQFIPFGLNIAPALFTRVLNKALVGCNDYCAIYVDDILVFSQDIKEHSRHLKAVFMALGMANFRVSMKKSTIGVDTVHYLGHILHAGRVEQDPSKITAVKEFLYPSTVKAIRRFLGMCGYYRRFIYNFSLIAAPLIASTQGKGKVLLTQEQKTAVDTLKNAMINAPVLEFFHSEKETRVEVDSCSTGVGAV